MRNQEKAGESGSVHCGLGKMLSVLSAKGSRKYGRSSYIWQQHRPEQNSS